MYITFGKTIAFSHNYLQVPYSQERFLLKLPSSSWHLQKICKITLGVTGVDISVNECTSLNLRRPALCGKNQFAPYMSIKYIGDKSFNAILQFVEIMSSHIQIHPSNMVQLSLLQNVQIKVLQAEYQYQLCTVFFLPVPGQKLKMSQN